MTTWLLKFGFGGVQEFIGQSRKARDLATGSRELADLARFVLRHVATQAEEKSWKADVLLPYDSGREWEACPHQIVLRIRDADESRVVDIGGELRTAAEVHWKTRMKEALRQADKTLVCSDEQHLAGQIDGALEIYWVALPSDEHYPTAFRRLRQTYDRRRHTRTFQQLQPPPVGFEWTCFQCGVRSAVVEKRLLERSHWVATGFFSKRDRLCAVCLGKRLMEGDRFPSTVRLAWDRLLRGDARTGILGCLRRVEPGAGDEQLLERAAEVLDSWPELDERYPVPETKGPKPNSSRKLPADKKADTAGKETEDVRKRFEALRGWLGESASANLRRAVSPYYALVRYDGDEMGRWFDGDHFREDSLESAQAGLSSALGEFARSVKSGLALRNKLLVYAGGDDGLALLPLDFLLPFLELVHDAWTQKVEGSSEVKGNIRNGEEDGGPFFSLHACVAHMHTPFQPALAEMDRDLKATKERGRRNAFSVRVRVRAGSSTLMIAPWDQLAKFTETVQAFSTWRASDVAMARENPRPAEDEVNRRRKEERLPTRLPHGVLAAARGLFDGERCVSPKVLRVECRRVCARSEGHGKPAMEQFLPWLDARAQVSWAETCPKGHDPLGTWESLSSGLVVPAFLARELDWGGIS